MGKRPKLLFISSCMPDPLGTGTEQRAYSFLLAYSKIMDVELWFYPRPENPNILRVSRIASLCQIAVPYDPQVVQREGEPINKRLVRSVLAADYVHFTQLLFVIKHPRIFWDVDELPWTVSDPDRTKIMVAEARDKDKSMWELYKLFTDRCTLRFASSAREAHPEIGEITVIPNCYRPAGPIEKHAESKTLLFVGNMGYPPNMHAVARFAHAILPHLPPPVKLRVVGRRPGGPQYQELLEKLCDGGRVELFYDVESCTPHYAAAAASVVPLMFGGGTRLKILESFGHRCPVVSSRKGCEGLDVTDGVELLIADHPQNFAAACMRLLSSAELRDEMSAAAFRFVGKNHSQDVVERRLYSALARVGVAGIAA